MIPPDRRSVHNIEVLVQATSRLSYFVELTKEKNFQDHNIHQKLCTKLIHVDESKGQAVIKRSELRLILDDVADRFFIILRGQVGVYKRREESLVQLEAEFAMTASALINLNFKDRAKELIAREEIIRLMDDSNRSKFKKLSSIKGSSLWFISYRWLDRVLQRVHKEAIAVFKRRRCLT